MAYISNSDIAERLGATTYVQLADDDGDGVADVGVVDEARLGAEGELDSYLARRYQLPLELTGHPELANLLASVALDLATYRLRLRRPPVSEDDRAHFERTVSWLEAVAAGRVHLPSVAALTSTNVQGIAADSFGESRLLSHDEFTDF
ncbi:MAG: phage protein Gp36 family protein [Phycisphaerae bacterium]